MTLRDLTERQLYNLRRRCEKERKEVTLRQPSIYYSVVLNDTQHKKTWELGYNAGLKAGLEFAK